MLCFAGEWPESLLIYSDQSYRATEQSKPQKILFGENS